MKPLYVKKNGTVNKVSGVAMPNTFPANRVGYDNTTSELVATNTQDAIDEVVENVADKADKVTSPTSGNLAGLNASGNLTDAGWSADKTTSNASGNPISISGLKSNQLAINPIITLEPIQAGSGDPSPSNVRAISGYDKIEVLSLRKNLFTDSSYVKTTDHGTFILRDYKVNLVTGTYTFSFDFSGSISTAQMVLYNGSDTDGSFVEVYDTGAFDIIAGRNSISFTINENAMNVKFYSNAIGTYSNFQLELGNIATSYEPYNPLTNIQLTLGQTIYGGSLDVKTGVLMVTKKFIDCRNLTYEGATSATGLNYCNVGDCLPGSAYSISNKLAFTSDGWNSSIPCISTNSGVTLLRIYGSQALFTTGDYADSIVVGTLKEPYTIQLTPHEISLLKDDTYVSTNGTNLSLSYHNGEIASLGDVSQLGQTVNLLGDKCNFSYVNLADNGTDLNDLRTPGIYSVGVGNSSTQHGPGIETWYAVYVTLINNQSIHVQQIAISLAGVIFSRYCYDNTWYPWSKLARPADIGFPNPFMTILNGYVNSTRFIGDDPLYFKYIENTGSNFYLHFRPISGYTDTSFTVYNRSGVHHCHYTVNPDLTISSIHSNNQDGSTWTTDFYVNTNNTVVTLLLGAWDKFVIIGQTGGVDINVDTTANPDS